MAIEGEAGRVTGLRLERNRLVGEAGSLRAEGTGERWTLPVGLVVRAVGYRSLPLADLPFDDEGGDHPQRSAAGSSTRRPGTRCPASMSPAG